MTQKDLKPYLAAGDPAATHATQALSPVLLNKAIQEAAGGGGAMGMKGLWPYLAGAGGAAAGGYGLGSLMGGEEPQPLPEPSFWEGAQQTGGDFLENVGSGTMGGIGSLLGALGLPGQESLDRWSGQRGTSQAVGGGTVALGTILAIMLLSRLMGGGGDE